MMYSKKLTWWLLAFYVLVLTWIIVFKFQFTFQGLDSFRNINLIPFGDSVIKNGVIDFSEIRDNALAFIPYGGLVFVLAQRKSFLKMVAPIFLTSLFYEVVQYIFAIRGSDITDIIANTTGGIIGIGIGFLMFRVFKYAEYEIRKIVNIVSLVVEILLFALMARLIWPNIRTAVWPLLRNVTTAVRPLLRNVTTEGLVFIILVLVAVAIFIISSIKKGISQMKLQMKLLSECKKQGHSWSSHGDECVCLHCYRREQHDWNVCVCRKCGAARDRHDWDGCICRKCGAARDAKYDGHDWNGCVCGKCGRTRDEKHNWNGCTCKSCGKTHHKLDDRCVCTVCGVTKHSWSTYTEEREGYTNHNYDPDFVEVTKCLRCGISEERRL